MAYADIAGGGTTTKKKPPYTADQIAASLSANPQASTGGYMGPPMGDYSGGQTAAPAQQANPFETNPGYLAALAAEQAGSQQADAALRAAQEAAIVGYGDPSIAAALGITDVSSNTQAAARQNYLAGNASLARLDRQRDLNQQTLQNNLAAHGIIRSGELGYQTGEIGRNYGNAVYDTQQQLLNNLNAAQQQNLATKSGLRSQTIGALTGAYDTMVANPSYYGAAGATPTVAGATGPSATNAALQGGTEAALPQNAVATALGRPRASSRLARTPLRNPYVTGQKRFG